jgi:hypothetical protein
MKLLTEWIEEKVSEEESRQRESYLDYFKKIVDNGRLPGHKLYSKKGLFS